MAEQHSQKRLPWLVVTFVLSAGMLAYEILLTRIASVLLTSQFVFLVLGISLLGISVGAVVEVFMARRADGTTEARPGLWLCWNALALAAALVLIVKFGAESGKLILGLSTALPFAVAGFVLARIFRMHAAWTGSLYAADLVGAALGALLVPVLLPAFGPIVATLLLAAAMAVTGFGIIFLQDRRKVALAGFFMMLAVLALGYLEISRGLLGPIPIGKDHNKDLYRMVHMNGMQAQIIDSRWSTFGRTDLVRFADDSSTMSIFIDGAAGASMLRFDGTFDDSSASFVAATQQFGGMVPLLGLKENQKDAALIIGPGGGRDVVLALRADFKKITAVEINPQMVQIVRDYRGFTGGIYTDYAQVSVQVAEGRDYLRHSSEKYDLIMLFMPITKSSRSTNAFALSETYLFTKEAFLDYYRHLTDEGSLLIMGHSMPEIAKIMTTAVAALREEGLPVQTAMDRLYLLGSEMMPLFGMRRQPVSPDESRFLHAAAHYTVFDCALSYIPGVEQQMARLPVSTAIDTQVPMMNPLFIDLAEGKVSMIQLAAGTGFNLYPATDDRPFFSRYTFGLPLVIQVVLWLALAILAVTLFFPVTYFRSRDASQETRAPFWALPVFFISIGIGYITIELALFQKLVFYLGDPSRSLAILLAALLVGSGIGSFATRNAPVKIAILGGLLSAVLAAFALAALPLVFTALHNASFSAKQIAAAAMLLLQGVPMGFMFPAGLRAAEARFGQPAIPWMWAINGSASVAGSALAIAIAMTYGYTWSLLFGAACYLVAAAVAIRTHKKAQLA